MPRIGLPTTLATRDATMAKDGILVNCYHEKDPTGEAITKRPGYSQGPNLGVGCAQGMVNYAGAAWALRSDTFYGLGGAVSFVAGIVWTSPSSTIGSGVRAGGGVFSLGGNLYFVGGGDASNTVYNDVWRSTDNGVTWTRIQANAAFSARALFGYCVYAGRMWITGGFTSIVANHWLVSSSTQDVWSSSDGITWIQATAAAGFGRRSYHTMTVANNLTYLAAGADNTGATPADFWASSDGITWTSMTGAALWTGRLNAALSALGSVLYLTGGVVSGTAQSQVYKSTNGGTTWTLVTSSPGWSARQGHALITFNNTLWLFGGIDNAGTSKNDVWNSTDGLSWTQVTAAAGWGIRSSFAYTVHNNTLFLAGGGARNSGFNDVLTPTAQDAWIAATSIPATSTTPLSPVPPTSCLPFQFAVLPAQGSNPPLLVMKNAQVMYVFNGAVLTKVTDPDYPASTVPGVAYLDGVFYVMDAKGIIYGSDFNDPTSWNALNFIAAQAEADNGVVIARQLNYVMAFKQWSTEVFYDAANPTGSALGRVQNALFEVGCAAAGSIAYSDNTIFFMASSRQKGRSIMKLEGYSPQPISTGFIDKILDADDLATVYAFVVKSRGHMFYVLTLKTTGITLVYDAKTGDWHRWTSLAAQATQSVTSLTVQADGLTVIAQTVTAHGYADGDPVNILGATVVTAANGQFNSTALTNLTFSYQLPSAQTVGAVAGTITAQGYTESYFPGVFYTYTANADLLLDETSGLVYIFDPTLNRDNGNPINVKVRTMIEDFGTSKQKIYGPLTIVGDRVTTTLLSRHTNDDYQTYSPYRPVNLGINAPQLNRLGKSRRRAHEFRHTDNTPLRLLAAELEVQ
jgi:hypothetical protein